MSARKFDITHPKKYGNVRVQHNLDFSIDVVLYDTTIISIDTLKHAVTLNSGGFRTVTTRTAINTALSQIDKFKGLQLFQKQFKWFIGRYDSEAAPFEDGMILKIK